MNLTNFKIIFRTFNKQKLPTFLSILVLTVGMASFMVIFFFIQHEKSYDRFWNQSENLYRIALEKTLKNGNKITSANNYVGLSRVIADEIPEIKTATSIWQDIANVYTPSGYLLDVKLFYTDTSFFKVFDCPFVAGSRTDPFPTIQSAVISETAAIHLFGRSNPINERFKLNEGWEFIVSGVFKSIPSNSHLKIDFLITRETLFYYLSHFNANTATLRMEKVEGSNEPAPSTGWLWQNPQAYAYVSLDKNSNIAKVEQKFNQIYNKYTQHLLTNGEKSKFILQPIASIHFDSHLDNELSPNTDRTTITALNVIAFLILLMSWVIFINFQITQSLERAKEIGLKKMAGARFSDLSIQILLQSLIINLVGMTLAFGVFFYVREYLGRFLGISSSLPIHNYLLGFMGIFMLGAIFSGLYPSFIIASRKAQTLLSKNFTQNNDSFNLRRALIVFQFAASIGLLIASTIIVLQVHYMRNMNVGLNIQNAIYTYTPMSMIKKDGASDKLKTFADELNRIPGVKAISVSSCIPGKEINFHSSSINMANHPDRKGDNFGIQTIDYRYQEVYEPALLGGRLFAPDDMAGSKSIVVNKEAARKLGYSDPKALVGQFVMVSVSDFLFIPESPYQVIGVIDDFHQQSLRKPIEPLLLINDSKWSHDVGYISILIGNSNVGATIASVKQKWEQFYPNDPFSYKFINDTYQEQIKADVKLASIFTAYTGLSVFLAVLGLLGLAANAAKKRTKEIGIRIVNGARVYEVIMMLNSDFIKWIAIAFIIACPVAWYAMHMWLENFAYKITLSWWIFIAAGVLAIVIAIVTVSWQSWRAATRNPVESLRYE